MIRYQLLLAGFFFTVSCCIAQQSGAQSSVVTIDSLFRLTEQNHKKLQYAKDLIHVAAINTAIARQERLPEAGAEGSLGYLSNAHVWDNRFNYMETIGLPHISNALSVEAGWTVFKGKAITENIEKAKLQELVAQLDYQKNKADIQLLILAKYLDLLTLYNQKKVYEQNLALAQVRMKNAEALYREGMVTHNDIVRNQLQITNLNLNVKELANSIDITNHELTQTLGLPEGTVIQVDTMLYHFGELHRTDSPAEQLNITGMPEMQLAKLQKEIAEKDLKLTRAEKLPVISLYASDGVSRPFLYSIPPLDIYMHYASAGIKLKYNISSLYKLGRHIQKADLETRLAALNQETVQETMDVQLHEAGVKYKESIEKWESSKESYALAKDNYNIMLQKYINRLAIMTDMVDASTALLSAQLQLSNAQVNIVYQYYRLLKQSGNWPSLQGKTAAFTNE
ncbi:TolC family protein [Niabella ginsenosidivorans]|nr:TolC family protein [Niabella ginsenosidivorans]